MYIFIVGCVTTALLACLTWRQNVILIYFSPGIRPSMSCLFGVMVYPLTWPLYTTDGPFSAEKSNESDELNHSA